MNISGPKMNFQEVNQLREDIFKVSLKFIQESKYFRKCFLQNHGQFWCSNDEEIDEEMEQIAEHK